MGAVFLYSILLVFLPVFIIVEGGPAVCGVRHVSRVISGKNAGLWPWQAELLMKQQDGTFKHQCGGSLINDQWVITATHCLFRDPDPTVYKVKLGEYDRSVHDPGEQEFDVTSVRLHRDFLTSKEYGYDIGMVKLSRKVKWTASVRPVCLPSPYQRIAPGTKCHLTGWGSSAYGSGPATILQEALLPIVSHSTCYQGNSHLHYVDNETMLCAGYGGNSTVSGCNGDSGGPLVCNEGGRFVLRGAVSWGDHKCGAKTTYTVFVRISSFIHWIYRAMMTQPQGYPACQNNHWYCTKWAQINLCSQSYYHKTLNTYCPITCKDPTCSTKQIK